MRHPNFVLLFVDSPAASASFYTDLLGKSPFESSPTFAAFLLEAGLMLGLWSKHTAEPTPTAAGGGTEFGFSVSDVATVDAMYADWTAKGIKIAQEPTVMDFGYTFVALDPDGHRLRVCALSGE